MTPDDDIPYAETFAPRHAVGREVELGPAVERSLALLPTTGPLTVLINDPQRHTASGAVLAEAVARVATARLRIVIASGSHRTPPAARDAFERALFAGPPPAAVAWHDGRAGDLRPVGPAGRWRAHPWLAQADGVLAIGSVEPHYFAGFTGAHKTATVGVAACEDIEANHAAALSPACRPGRIEGNPVAEGVLAMLADLEADRPVAAVNLVQAGRTILAAAGDSPRDALDAAIEPATVAFLRRSSPADAVVAEVAGPLGRSFYQADKGIKNNEWAVRDGGCLILVAPCPDGLGQDHFARLLADAPTHADALEIVRRRGYRLGDHKAVRLRHLTDPAARGVRAAVVSEGLAADHADLLGLSKAPSAAAALADAGIDPAARRVLRIRDAGNLAVLPDRD